MIPCSKINPPSSVYLELLLLLISSLIYSSIIFKNGFISGVLSHCMKSHKLFWRSHQVVDTMWMSLITVSLWSYIDPTHLQYYNTLHHGGIIILKTNGNLWICRFHCNRLILCFMHRVIIYMCTYYIILYSLRLSRL